MSLCLRTKGINVLKTLKMVYIVHLLLAFNNDNIQRYSPGAVRLWLKYKSDNSSQQPDDASQWIAWLEK